MSQMQASSLANYLPSTPQTDDILQRMAAKYSATTFRVVSFDATSLSSCHSVYEAHLAAVL